MKRLDVEEAGEAYLKALVYGKSGCIAGDMHVHYSVRSADGTHVHNWKGGTFEKLYHRFNRLEMKGSGHYQRDISEDARFFVACMYEDGRIEHREIDAVIFSGIKKCVRVTTIGGHVLACTPDHPLATETGFKAATEVGIGGKVLVHNGTRWTSDKSERIRVNRPEIFVKNHPHAPTKIVRNSSGEYTYKRLKRSRAVYEAAMNGMSTEAFVEKLNSGNMDGLRFVEPGCDIHHIDENPLNDVPSNLVALSHSDHAREHVIDADGRNAMPCVAEYDEIALIEDLGELPTYDLRMKTAPRNFVVEGFVVHNTGKTSFGVSAPKPLILLSERQGYPHIVSAAKRLGRPQPTVLFVETTEDYGRVVNALHGDKSLPFVVKDGKGNDILRLEEWPESVVVDSLTDACARLVDDIRRQSPPKEGRDGLPVDSERFWNVLADRFSKMVHMFRDAPLHVLFLCLLDERQLDDAEDPNTKHRWIGPQLMMRKMPGVVQAAVNVVGVTYRKTAAAKEKGGDREVTYGIMTCGPDYFELKPFRPLRDHEVTDFRSWCKRIVGIDDGQAAPAAPDVSEITETKKKAS
jgi:hypothetical protein